MKPKVTICVPNLNTLPFLEERFETIFAQTFEDWELLIYDSFSEDGAWECIQEVAATDPRIRAWQGPREGTPGSWTPCIREAEGDYVYIATSDDTMPPNFLREMVEGLEQHPDCGLAHAPLKAIDESGNETEENQWWSTDSLFARSSKDLVEKPHVRRAPFDGLLHMLGETVYTSITQLLIRRELFEKVGYFVRDWGAPGDYAWDMRASLIADTLHVPSTWGGWRLHSAQATDRSLHETDEYAEKIDAMIHDSLEFGRSYIAEPLARKLYSSWQPLASDHRRLRRVMSGKDRRLERFAILVSELLKGAPAAKEQLSGRLKDKALWVDEAPHILKEWVEHEGGRPVLEECPAPQPSGRGAIAS